jgi:DNA polymerase-3 subunit delta
MFGDKKYVWLRGLNWLAGDSILGKSEGGKACVEKLVEVLQTVDPSGVAVVISAYPVNGIRREAKWLKENGEGRVFQTVDKSPFAKNNAEIPGEIAAMFENECRELRLKVRGGVLQELFERVGRNTRLTLEEINKIACYLGPDGGEITSALLLKLVPVFGDGDFFEPVEAFYSGNLEWALDSLRRFFFNEPGGERGLLASLQKRNRLILQLKALLDAGALRAGGYGGVTKDALARAAAAYGSAFGDAGEKSELNIFTQSPFYLGKLVTNANRFTLRNLTDIQLALTDTFASLMDPAYRDIPEVLFRELFIRSLGLLSRATGEARN